MEISFRFKDLRDMMIELPKFMTLVGSDKPFTERLQEALPPDPHTLTIKVTPADGVPFTDDEKRKITAVLTEFVKNPEGFKAETVKDKLEPAKDEAKAKAAEKPAEESEADKSPAPKEKPAEKPAEKQSGISEVDARARLNQLVKATKYNAAVKLIFSHFGAKVFGDLKPEDYEAAVKMADELEKLSEDDLLAKFKEAGIKAKKKEA